MWEFSTLLLDAMRCSASNATYLGIRAFFKQLVTRQTNRPGHSRPCLYTTSSTRRAATSTAQARPPSEHQLPLEVYFSEGSPLLPSTRFDWRLRATSRSKGRLVNSTPTDQQRYTARKGYVKRVAPPYTRTQPGDDYFEEIHAYNERFLPLLEAEQAEGEAVLRERLATWSLARLCQEGYCLTELSAFWMDAPQFGRPVACFLWGPGVVFTEHRFQNGTQVLVSRFDPLQEAPYRGSVLSTTASQIRIAFEDKFDLDDGLWRVDVGLSNIVFDRMRAAIARLSQDPRAQEDDRAPDRQYILQGTHLRDVLLHSFSPQSASLHEPLQAPDDVAYVPRETLEHRSREGRAHGGGAFEDDMRIHSWAQRYARAHPIEMDSDPALEGLNPTQIRAIAVMVGERISLVQGVSSWGSLTTRHLTRFPSHLSPLERARRKRSSRRSSSSRFFFQFRAASARHW